MLSFGDVFWEGIRTATGYTHDELLQLPHLKDAADIKPCLETLDLVDVSWTDRSALQKLRDDLDHRLQCRHDFLLERAKRAARKFDTKNYIADKKYEAALHRDREASFTASDILLRFKRIDFTDRNISSTDADTLGGLMHVQELVLTDNTISVLSALPPMAKLATLASNEIHRVQLQFPQTSLMALSLAGNCVRTLDFVQLLPNLSLLDVSYNCITSVEGGAACAAVVQHPKLAELNLMGNPVTLLPDYRPRLEALLRGAVNPIVVDGQAVSVASSSPAATAVISSPSTSPTAAAAASTETKPVISVHFQVLNVKGYTELSHRNFDLAACGSKCAANFYTPSMLDHMASQATMQIPVDSKGKGGGGKSAAAFAAQQAAAAEKVKGGADAGGKPPHEVALHQWCAQVSTSLRVQALWKGEERTFSLDELMQVHAAAATSDEQQVTLGNIVSGTKPPAFLSLSAAAAAAQAQKEALIAAQQAAIAQATQVGSSSKGGGGKEKGRGGGGGGGGSKTGHAAAAQAEALNQKEQVVRTALHAASAEFTVPEPASALRPTLMREMMIPLRFGLILSVAGAPEFSASELPVATLGWASLSPAEILQYTNSCTATAKLGVDRATLLTARERVAKLTQQLVTIRVSLEKECNEYAWRRDTEFGGSSFVAKDNAGAASGAGGGGAANSSKRGGAGSSKKGGGGGGAAGGGSSPAAAPPPMNAAETAAMDAFLQSQAQGRKRADDTIRRLVLESAVLSMVEALERAPGASSSSSSSAQQQQVVVEGRFALCKPGFRGGDGDQNGDGSGTGKDGDAADGAAGAGGAGDKKDDASAVKGASGAAGKKSTAGTKKRK